MSHALRTAVVLSVDETSCELHSATGPFRARFAPQFPSPRVERVSPGHLVAIAGTPDGECVVLWRWYDAVVLGHDGGVQLWEPAHGEVVASARPGYERVPPGSRAYASAGLPGAPWWVACAVTGDPSDAPVELDEVRALYVDSGMWDDALAPPA